MTRAHYERLVRMTDARRCRVVERAAIIHEATGCTWPEADERAFAEEGIATQQELGGV